MVAARLVLSFYSKSFTTFISCSKFLNFHFKDTLYEKDKQACCTGAIAVHGIQLVDIPEDSDSGIKCCLLKFKPNWYDPKTQICSISNGIKDKDDVSDTACGLRDYNSKKEPLKKCCRKRFYNAKTGSTTIHSELSDGVKTKCCNGREGSALYATASQVCCKGKIHQRHLW